MLGHCSWDAGDAYSLLQVEDKTLQNLFQAALKVWKGKAILPGTDSR